MNWTAIGLVVTIAGCSGLKAEGQCTYVREVKTTYQCSDGGKIEHYRVEPAQN